MAAEMTQPLTERLKCFWASLEESSTLLLSLCLPVVLLSCTTAEQPTAPETPRRLAVLLLIENSGGTTGRNLEIMKEACIATATMLSRGDMIGVIALDPNARPVLEFTDAERLDIIADRIHELEAGKQTRILPALKLAHRMFEIDPRAKSSAYKYVLLVSDGDSPQGEYENAVACLVKKGVSVSTLCLPGATFDPVMMNQISNWGKGRFFFAGEFAIVPKMMLNETQQILAAIPREVWEPSASYEEDVLVAAFRDLLKHAERGPTCFIEIQGAGKNQSFDPSASFIQRLNMPELKLCGASKAKMGPNGDGVFDSNGQSTYVYYVRLRSCSQTLAEIDAGKTGPSLGGEGYNSSVVRENGVWVIKHDRGGWIQ